MSCSLDGDGGDGGSAVVPTTVTIRRSDIDEEHGDERELITK